MPPKASNHRGTHPGAQSSRNEPTGAASQSNTHGQSGLNSSRSSHGAASHQSNGGTAMHTGGHHSSHSLGHMAASLIQSGNPNEPRALVLPPLIRDPRAEAVVSVAVKTLIEDDERLKSAQDEERRIKAEEHKRDLEAQAAAAELEKMPSWLNTNLTEGQLKDPLINSRAYESSIVSEAISMLKMQQSATPEDAQCRTGLGYARFLDGAVYEGEWQDGHMHGRGTYVWTDGAIYEGEWIHSKIKGRGKLTWPDGSFYIGKFQDGHRHGKGIFTHKETGVTYRGEWVFGIRHGRGRIDYGPPGSAYYVGQFRKGLRHGLGRIVYVNAPPNSVTQNASQSDSIDGPVVYEGSWENGKKHGWGAMCWGKTSYRPTTLTYDTQTSDCVFEAKSTRGCSYIGWWKDDYPEGEGECIWDVDLTSISSQLQRNVEERAEAREARMKAKAEAVLSLSSASSLSSMDDEEMNIDDNFEDEAQGEDSEINWNAVPWANHGQRSSSYVSLLGKDSMEAYERINRFSSSAQPFMSRALTLATNLKSPRHLASFAAGRNTYIGSFTAGKRHGPGTLVLSTGAIYSGSWHHDRKQGLGTFVFESGFIHKGLFEDDNIEDEKVWINAAIDNDQDGQQWNLPINDLVESWARKLPLVSPNSAEKKTIESHDPVLFDSQVPENSTSVTQEQHNFPRSLSAIFSKIPSQETVAKLTKEENKLIAHIIYRNYASLLDTMRYYASLAPFVGASDVPTTFTKNIAPKEIVLTVEQVWKLLCDAGLSSRYLTRADFSRIVFHRFRKSPRVAEPRGSEARANAAAASVAQAALQATRRDHAASHELHGKNNLSQEESSICACSDEHEETRICQKLDSLHDPIYVLTPRRFFEVLIRVAAYIYAEVPRHALPRSTSTILEKTEALINQLYLTSGEQHKLMVERVQKIIEKSVQLRASLSSASNGDQNGPEAQGQVAQNPQNASLQSDKSSTLQASSQNALSIEATKTAEALAEIASLPYTIENPASNLNLEAFNIDNMMASTNFVQSDGSMRDDEANVAFLSNQIDVDEQDTTVHDLGEAPSPSELLKWLIVHFILGRAKSVSLVESAYQVLPSQQLPVSSPNSAPTRIESSESLNSIIYGNTASDLKLDSVQKGSKTTLTTSSYSSIPSLRLATCAARDAVRVLYRKFRASERRLDCSFANSIEDPDDEEAFREKIEDDVNEFDPSIGSIENTRSVSTPDQVPLDEVIDTCKGSRTLLSRQYLPSQIYCEPNNWKNIVVSGRKDSHSWPGASWGHYTTPYSLAPSPSTMTESSFDQSVKFSIPKLLPAEYSQDKIFTDTLTQFKRVKVLQSGRTSSSIFSHMCRAPAASLRSRTISVRSVIALLAERKLIDPLLPAPNCDGRAFIERYLKGESISSTISLNAGQQIVPHPDAKRFSPTEEAFKYTDGYGELVLRIDIGMYTAGANMMNDSTEDTHNLTNVNHSHHSSSSLSTTHNSFAGTATTDIPVTGHRRQKNEETSISEATTLAVSASNSSSTLLSNSIIDFNAIRSIELTRRIQEAQLLQDHSLTVDTILRLISESCLLPEQKEASRRYLCAVYVASAGLFFSSATQRLQEEVAVRKALREAEIQRQKIEQEQAAAQAAQAAAEASRSQMMRGLRNQRASNNSSSTQMSGSASGSAGSPSGNSRPVSGRVGLNPPNTSSLNTAQSPLNHNSADNEGKNKMPREHDEQAVSDVTIRLQAHRVGLYAVAKAMCVRDREEILGLELTEEELLDFLSQFSVLRSVLKESRDKKLEKFQKAVASMKSGASVLSGSEDNTVKPSGNEGVNSDAGMPQGSEKQLKVEITNISQPPVVDSKEAPENILKCFMIFHPEVIRPFLPPQPDEIAHVSEDEGLNVPQLSDQKAKKSETTTSTSETDSETQLPVSAVTLLNPYTRMTSLQMAYCVMSGKDPSNVSLDNNLQRFLFGLSHNWWVFCSTLESQAKNLGQMLSQKALSESSSSFSETTSENDGTSVVSKASPSSLNLVENSYGISESEKMGDIEGDKKDFNPFTQLILQNELNNFPGLLLPEVDIKTASDDKLSQTFFQLVDYLLDKEANPPAFFSTEHSLAFLTSSSHATMLPQAFAGIGSPQDIASGMVMGNIVLPTSTGAPSAAQTGSTLSSTAGNTPITGNRSRNITSGISSGSKRTLKA